MKKAILLSLVIAASLALTTCKNDGKKAASDTSSASASAPSASAVAVKHYICPNNCAGSGGDTPGQCPVCKTEYQHNDAYHQQPGQQPTPQPSAPAVADPASSGQSPVIQMPPSNDPPQNAKGVWHYTCPKGCLGGSGAAGPCPKCGEQLAHNAAYHE